MPLSAPPAKWETVLNKPSTLSGFGITDGIRFIGGNGQVFSSSGVFTIPAGVNAIKMTIQGGGGGGGGASGTDYGACGFSISSYTNGGTGGTSSISSGTQSISTVSATGGIGGINGQPLRSGIGSGGALSMRGPETIASFYSGPNPSGTSTQGAGGYGIYSPPGGSGGAAIHYLSGLTAGLTLTCTVGAGGAAAGGNAQIPRAGGAGFIMIEW